MNAPDAAARFGSGRAVPRIEDRALLEGRGRFTDNVAVPGETVIAFLRSPYAHARIAGIDVDAARAMPGVIGVFTGADLAAAGVKGLPTTPDFRRADGRSTVSPLRRALAHEVARDVATPEGRLGADRRRPPDLQIALTIPIPIPILAALVGTLQSREDAIAYDAAGDGCLLPITNDRQQSVPATTYSRD